MITAAQRAIKIKLLILDIDGVLTDGRIIYKISPQESKSFDVKDGYGIKLLIRNGIEVSLLTSRSSIANRLRAAELGITEVVEKAEIKIPIFYKLLFNKRLSIEQVAYMGDDLVDLPPMRIAGLALAPANAVLEVRKFAHWIARYSGGKGAVRQACEFILRAQGRWNF